MNAEDIHVDVQNIPAYDVCADETFDSPTANRRTGKFLRSLTPEERIMRSLDVVGVVGAYMAGTRCPTPKRLTKLVHDVSDIQEWEKWSVRELFGQMDPLECVEFMRSTDASPRKWRACSAHVACDGRRWSHGSTSIRATRTGSPTTCS